MGDKHFTTFVEIKKPSTPLYASRKNRSGSWCLADELIYAVSQILEHKSAGQIKLDKEHYIKGEPLKQKAYDSKVILIIGHWSELKMSTKYYKKVPLGTKILVAITQKSEQSAVGTISKRTYCVPTALQTVSAYVTTNIRYLTVHFNP